MKKIIVLLLCFVTFTCSAADIVTFYDISDYGWASDAIFRLADKDIIKGTAPHYYSPGNFVSKADLATLLGRIFNMNGDGLSAYPDVPADSYYHSSVATLKALGITEPYPDGGFHPGDAITREETMRWAGFLLERFGFAQSTDISCLDRFGDKALISEENRKYVAILINGGYITGDDPGNLNPKGYLTRAETAVILDRLYSGLFVR